MKWYKWLALACITAVGFWVFFMPPITIGNMRVGLLHADWAGIYNILKAGNYKVSMPAIVFTLVYWCLAGIDYAYDFGGLKEWLAMRKLKQSGIK